MQSSGIHDLLHGAENPRNSEGSFLRTADGRIRFIYTRYTGGGRCAVGWDDHARADLAEMISEDGGETWRDNGTVVSRGDADNIMSVSLLRLQTGGIRLFYLEKRFTPAGQVDCIPMMRCSDDEGETWSEARRLIPHGGYFVMHNDRAVQLASGRIALPFSSHLHRTGGDSRPGIVFVLFSDDEGETWRESETTLYPNPLAESRHGLQEPVLIELEPGKLRMWSRTALGWQFVSDSADNGDHWSAAVPDLNFPAPLSPLSVKRDPATGFLYAVWNGIDRQLYPVMPNPDGSDRTPLVLMRSCDNGATWERRQAVLLETGPDRGYCYTAMHFEGKSLLLGYCFGQHRPGGSILQDLRLRKVDLGGGEL